MDVGGPIRSPYDGGRALAAWAWDNRRFVKGRVRLSGADPDDLTIGAAIECAYALLVEAYMGLGMDMLTATESVDRSVGIEVETVTGPAPGAQIPTPAENDAALASLSAMIGGIA